MDGIRCYNYDSFSLETKFAWMQTGAGANAATGFGRMLAQLSADFAAAESAATDFAVSPRSDRPADYCAEP